MKLKQLFAPAALAMAAAVPAHADGGHSHRHSYSPIPAYQVENAWFEDGEMVISE